MEYEVTTLDAKFTIKQELLGEVFGAIKDHVQYSTFGGAINVHQRNAILNEDYLDDMLGNRFGWFPLYSKKNGQRGDIIDFKYQWECENSELSIYLFNILAPFVEAGSYIEMCDDKANRWRYAFNGKTMKRLTPTMVYEDFK
jgi:hypothetical protein